jgi:hypothetical protein
VRAPRDVWNRLGLDINYGSKSLAAYCNDRKIVSDFAFAEPWEGMLVDAGFSVSGGPDPAWFGNFSVSAVPF